MHRENAFLDYVIFDSRNMRSKLENCTINCSHHTSFFELLTTLLKQNGLRLCKVIRIYQNDKVL